MKRLLTASILAIAAAPIASAATKGVLDGLRTPQNAAYTEECSACHVAYPAEFLPAKSWQRLLQSWDRHFGVDASPDSNNVGPIKRYLLENARPVVTAEPGPPPERITRARWFTERHRETRDGTWPKVKTASNCAACHPDASKGIYRNLVDRKSR
jgi:cytochrome c553